jgi:hypothetical protein
MQVAACVALFHHNPNFRATVQVSSFSFPLITTVALLAFVSSD